jgi:hypothetical protein
VVTGQRVTRPRPFSDVLAVAHVTAARTRSAASPTRTGTAAGDRVARRRSPTADAHRAPVIDRYVWLRQPMKQISAELGIGYGTVQRILVDAGIERRSRGHRQRRGHRRAVNEHPDSLAGRGEPPVPHPAGAAVQPTASVR